MKRIVVYKSSTGFTEQYAGWIAEVLECSSIALKDASAETLKQYDQVIFGGSIMGSGIVGFTDILNMNANNLVVFAVGFSERTEETINQIREKNPLNEIPFYYFRGGLRYEKMNFMFRFMLKRITKEKKSCDLSNRDDISELTDALQ